MKKFRILKCFLEKLKQDGRCTHVNIRAFVNQMWDGKELVVDLTVTGFTMPRFIPGIPKINYMTGQKI